MRGKLFQGRPVGRQRGRAFMLGVGIGTLLLFAFMFKVGYDAQNTVPGRGYYNLHAELPDAENLGNHYEARIGGVRAGQLLKPRVRNGKALFDLRLDDKFKPLRSDTQMTIRLRSAVGVRYLEIIPGTHGTPLSEGATIPASNSRSPVALDKVLGIFDAKTGQKVRTFLNELGQGTLGRGRDLNGAIKGAPKFMSTLGSFSEELVNRRGALARLLRETDGAADAFLPVRYEIANGFRPEAQAMRPFREARPDVEKMLEAAAPALARLRSSLPAVSGMVAEAGRLGARGRPALEEAAGALASTAALLRDSRVPLENTKRTLELAKEAVGPTLGLLDKVRPVLPGIERMLNDLFPTISYVSPRSCGLSHAFTGWATQMKYGDSHSNFMNFHVNMVRPYQPGGVTDTPLLPDGKGGDLRDQLVLAEGYPEPCNGQYGEAGPPGPTVQENVKDYTYTRARQPGFEAPGYHGIDEALLRVGGR